MFETLDMGGKMSFIDDYSLGDVIYGTPAEGKYNESLAFLSLKNILRFLL